MNNDNTLLLLKEKLEKIQTQPQAKNSKESVPPPFLSRTQKQLYAFQKLHPNSTTYNLAFGFEIHGNLDIKQLNHAMQVMIERHELLRAHISEVEEQLCFEIFGFEGFEIELEEWSSTKRPPVINEWISSFDFTDGLLIRAKLICLAPEHHIFFLDVPHIIADGASLSLFVKELIAVYQNHMLPPIKARYRDYIAWRYALQNSEAHERQVAYWKQELLEAPEPLQLPQLSSRWRSTELTGDLFHFYLEEAQTNRVRKLCLEHKITPFIFFMAIYQVFLSKICNQLDITVGTSIEGRSKPEFRNIFGLFINTIPIRGVPNPSKTFHSFIKEVRTKCLSGIEHQYYSFEDLEQLKDGSLTLYQTIFDFHQNQIIANQSNGLNFSLIPPKVNEAKFDLSLEGFDEKDRISFHFEYRTALFSQQEIEKLSQQFLSIIHQALENPESPIASLELCTKEEHAEVARQFHSMEDGAEDHVFLDAFRNQVKRVPDRIAVNSRSSQLTYRHLDNLSTHLARQLITRGVGEEDCVAFYLKRDIDFLVAMLAVFKLGACYVPLDLKVPKNRLLELLAQSGSKVMLVDSDLKWVPIDQLQIKTLLNQPVISYPVNSQTDSQNLAYIIFTSGSTGQPKGAMVEHRGMMNHLLAKVEDFKLTDKDVIAQTSSQTFDVSVWQFLNSLVVGGRLSIFDDDDAWTTQPLLEELEKNLITVFETVPSHMRLIIDDMSSGLEPFSLKELRILVINGESLPPSICRQWSQKYSDIELVNAYGPTECSDDVTHYLIREALGEHLRSIPIGRPVRNTPIMILDSTLSLLPKGICGELCIGGIGVGRGYLGNPVKTADCFMPNPFSSLTSLTQRIYRSGDLAFLDASGVFEHIGRKDHQIKINGQRVELGEIEAVISSHPNVSQCVVVANKLGQTHQLGAYLLLRTPQDLDGIWKYLQAELPKHMIPSQMMDLDRFPYLPSGKIDRKSLPPLKFKVETRSFITPVSPTEKMLSKIWRDLFLEEKIGKESHFFELGGHSLLAVQLAGRILKHFKIKIPIRSMYEHPRLCDQALYIDRMIEQSDQKASHLPEIVPDKPAIHLAFPLTEVQQAYWLGRKGIFGLGEVSVHVYSEYDCNSLDLDALEHAWHQMILRHDALRIIFLENGSQKILSDVPKYEFAIQDCTDVSSDEASAILDKMRDQFSHEVFPSDQWPLFAIRAIQLPKTTRLYLSFDALIMDGWSVDLLFQEWMQLYRNPQTHLPPLQLSFRDCVIAIENLRNHPLYQTDKTYWQHRIETFPSAPPLPIKKSPDQIEHQRFSRCSKKLPSHMWLSAQKSIQSLRLSPTGFLAFLFSEVLYLYTGQSHFAINLTLFDRPPLHPEINHIVGDFTSLTLLEIHRNPLFAMGERAKIVQDQLWQDLDHHLFGGIAFIRELSKMRAQKGESAEFPVVLTSVLGLDDQQTIDLAQQFGEEVFSITQTPQVWLDFKAYEVGGDLVVEWDYVTELFEDGFVESMHASFLDALVAFTESPDQWLKTTSLPILAEQRWERIAYNATEKAVELWPLHQLVAVNGKNAPAVITTDQNLSYEDLNLSSNLIAHQLMDSGMQPGDLVAIVMHKDWHQPVAVMGILKAGGAYLPVDGSLPNKRIERLLNTAEIRYIVTQQELENKVKNLAPAESKLVILDKNHSRYPSDFPDVPCRLDDLAYVIFTSGSTGVPKGVVLQHGPVCNTILDMVTRFDIKESDRVLGLSNLNFDLSVFDFFGIFHARGALVLPDESRLKDASHWIELLIKHNVTIWNSAPMFMQMLVEYLEGAAMDLQMHLKQTLRLVLLSGDWIPTDLPVRVAKFFPNARLVSLGGATEASIWSIYYEIDAARSFVKSIPYGVPLSNQHFHVLNDEMEMSPDRVPGKLYIGGNGLAMGYLNDKEKTQTSFIEHPRYGKIYSTGDIGAFHPEIGIEFLGREDNQVKIRGHRIELGEVESSIRENPLVDYCVALVSETDRVSKSLVACVVPIKDPVEVAIPDSIILDANERTHFTLKQHGLEFPEDSEKIIQIPRLLKTVGRKSHRSFNGEQLDQKTLQTWLLHLKYEPLKPKQINFLTKEDLFALLQQIGIENDSGTLPKYPYPSAGSLYPVQTHVYFDSWNLPRGRYLFNPKSYQLIERDLKSIENGPSLRLIGKKEAIEPLYGPLADSFCAIESGYMFAIIRRFLDERAIGYTLSFENSPVIRFINTWNCPSPSQPLDVLVYIKEDAIETMEGGWYFFDFSTGALERSSNKSQLFFHPDNQDAFAIFQDASGGVFFIDREEQNLDQAQIEFWSGVFGQILMEQGVGYNIGSCPLGRLDGVAQGSFNKRRPVHYLLFGSVSREQLDSKKTSTIRENAFESMVQQWTSDRLPSYMVPQQVKKIASIPLTPNGKVDTNALSGLFEIIHERKKEIALPRTPGEKMLTKIWSEILGIQTISIFDNFFEIGGNSLLITKMALQVKETFKVDIPLVVFFQSTQIASLAQALETSREKVEVTEDTKLAQDIVLDQTIHFSSHPQDKSLDVFLTGASGFLGIHLLANFLNLSTSRVFCHLRAKDKQEGIERLYRQADHFGLLKAIDFSRVVPVIGNLEKPKLGCRESDWQSLLDQVGTVIHNGSFVHHVYDYEKLRGANVLSTLELIKLCSQKKKRMVYISSLLSIVDRDTHGTLIEDFPLGESEALYGGYQKTKWASEILLKEAHSRGLDVAVIRPNTISGQKETGRCSYQNDHFLRLVKGCTQMGFAPIWDEVIDLLPVDEVSRIIFEIASDKRLPSPVFNLTSPAQFHWLELLEWLKREEFKIELVDPEKWRTEHLPKIGPSNALYPLLAIYLAEGPAEHRKMIASTRNMQQYLKQKQMNIPNITEKYLKTLFNFLSREHFL